MRFSLIFIVVIFYVLKQGRSLTNNETNGRFQNSYFLDTPNVEDTKFLIKPEKLRKRSVVSTVSWDDVANCAEAIAKLILSEENDKSNQFYLLINQFKTDRATLLKCIKPALDVYNLIIKFVYKFKYNDLCSCKAYNTISPLEELTVYAINHTHMSIRWKMPRNASEKLEKYTVTITRHAVVQDNIDSVRQDVQDSAIQYYNISDTIRKISLPADQECDLYEEYVCTTINYETKNANVDYKNYKILVEAKYENNSVATEISGEIMAKRNSAPRNLSYKWKNGSLIVIWKHPLFPINYIYSFRIFFNSLSNTTHNFYETKIITKPEREYFHTVKTKLNPASSYDIYVVARNKMDGFRPRDIRVDIPPKTPKLYGEFKIEDPPVYSDSILLYNTTFDVYIPPIKPDTLSGKSSQYLMILEEDNISSYIDENDICKMLDIAANHENIYLDYILNSTNKDQKVGNKSVTFNFQGMKKSVKELKKGTNYEIALILKNEYKNLRKCEIYYFTVKTFKNMSFMDYFWYGLLILVILIIAILPIVFFLKKRNNKSIEQSPIILANFHPGQDYFIAESNDYPREYGFEENVSYPENVNVLQKNKNDETVDAMNGEFVELRNKSKRKNHGEPSRKNNFTKRIPLKNFEQYVKESIESGYLDAEHSLCPKGKAKTLADKIRQDFEKKNTYLSLLADDGTNVKLNLDKKGPCPDYLCANFIDGYCQKKAYIVTRGPKKSTVNDFWQMIWQENVKNIIMLSNIDGQEQNPCEQYWPSVNNVNYGDLNVNFLESQLFADFAHRVFRITYKNETRKLEQYHFISWPENGVPLYSQQLSNFLPSILKISHQQPTVVHCSSDAGIGTLILCDICCRMAAKEGHLDIVKYMQELRLQKPSLVNCPAQYKFVHLVLLQTLLAPPMTLDCRTLTTAIEKIVKEDCFQSKMEYLRDVAWQDRIFKSEKGKVGSQIYQNVEEINAIFVDGFRCKNQFIVTKIPHQNVTENFWKMIYKTKCRLIVSLNEIAEENQNGCNNLIPILNDVVSLKCGIWLKCTEIEELETCKIISLLITKDENDYVNEEFPILLMQFKNWKKSMTIPANINNFINLFVGYESVSRGKSPVTVMCSDGVTASGIFVSFAFIVEKMLFEQIFDIFLAVRVVRRNRPQFITDTEQLKFLYMASSLYMQQFEIYANFQ